MMNINVEAGERKIGPTEFYTSPDGMGQRAGAPVMRFLSWGENHNEREDLAPCSHEAALAAAKAKAEALAGHALPAETQTVSLGPVAVGGRYGKRQEELVGVVGPTKLFVGLKVTFSPTHSTVTPLFKDGEFLRCSLKNSYVRAQDVQGKVDAFFSSVETLAASGW
jgi:hypothetical protein